MGDVTEGDVTMGDMTEGDGADGGASPLAAEEVEAYFQAARWARDAVAAPAVAASWDAPSALPLMTVGALAAHLVQAGVTRVEQAAHGPAPEGMGAVDLVTFYGGNRLDTPDEIDGAVPTALRQMAAIHAERGHAEILGSLDRRLARLEAVLPTVPAGRPVPSLSVPGATAPFDVFLRTRVVELVVHGDDLGAGALAPPPVAAMTVALGVVVELARSGAGDLDVLRAFTRVERARPGALRVF